MRNLLRDLQGLARSRLSPEQQRGVRIWVGLLSVAVAGLTLTGIWQLVAFESDPAWFSYRPELNNRQAAQPYAGVAELHSLLADAAFVIGLLGGAWFAARVAFTVNRFAMFALVLALVGLFSGTAIRYNVVKIDGRSLEEAGRGYVQLFTNNVEYVVTDKADLGAGVARLLTVAHVAVVPAIAALGWFAARRAVELTWEEDAQRRRREWKRSQRRAAGPDN